MKPDMITLQHIGVTLLSDTAYIDLTSVNGEIHTFLMEKKSEPNIFEATKYEKGHHVEAYEKEYNARN